MPASDRKRRVDWGKPAAFLGEGKAALSIAGRDWSSTSLGPAEEWPHILKAATAFLLRSPLPMLMLWGEDGIFFYNDAYSAFSGDQQPNLLGSKLRDRSELADLHGAALQAGLAVRTLSYRDREIVCHRGERHERAFVDLDYWPVIDESGRAMGVFGSVVERTRSVTAERKISETAERFRAFLVASTTTMYRMSPDWKEMRQLDGQGFLSDTLEPNTEWLTAYIHPDDQAFVLAKIDEAIRGRKIFDLEHRVRLADGGLGWTHSRAVPIFDEHGEIVEWFGAASDVTERKRMEQALREREQQFRSMADALPQLAWIADETGWIYWYNRRWYEYTGTTLQEMVGWGWRKVHHPDHVERVVQRIQHSWNTGELWEDTFPLRGADGQYRWFLSRAVPIKDAEGRLIRWFGTNTDITERQKREDFQKLLLHEVSHRVKNSVAMVSGLLELQAKNLEGIARDTLEDASIRVRTVATVHDHLWRQSDAQEIDLAPFLSDLAAGLATAAPQHRTLVDMEAAIVSADAAVPIGLLINELVTNAYKHAYAPGEEGDVRISGKRVADGRYQLEVVDTGRGVPDGFDIGRSRASLGMRVVTNLAAQLGGTVTVSSADPGARFTVVFPIKERSASTS